MKTLKYKQSFPGGLVQKRERQRTDSLSEVKSDFLKMSSTP